MNVIIKKKTGKFANLREMAGKPVHSEVVGRVFKFFQKLWKKHNFQNM